MAVWGSLWLLLLAALMGDFVRGEELKQNLDKFSEIRSCLPLNVLVQPDKGNKYSLRVISNKAAVEAISAEVSKGVLSLSTKSGFEVDEAIELRVTLPKDKLERVVQSGSGGTLVVQKGFKGGKMNVVNDAGEVLVFGVDVDSLVVRVDGVGSTLAEGKIKKARVVATGTTSILLKGVSDEVKVALLGTANLSIVSGSRDLLVSGMANDLASVQVDRGSCEVAGGFGFSPPCTLEDVEFPTIIPQYSCGIVADGTFECPSDVPGIRAIAGAVASTGCNVEDPASLNMF